MQSIIRQGAEMLICALGQASLRGAIVLICFGVIKVIITLCNMRWLLNHGSLFRRRLESLVTANPNKTVTGEQVRTELKIIDGSQCKLAIGVLEYKLYGTSGDNSIIPRILRTIAKYAFRVPVLLCSVWLFYFWFPPQSADAGLYWIAVGFVYQIEVVLILLDGVIAYLTLGSYGGYYHIGIRAIGEFKINLKTEIGTFAAVIFSTLVVDVFIFLVSVLQFGAFRDTLHSVNLNDHSGTLLQVWRAAYFVVTTLSTVGYGDIAPSRTMGQAISMLMHLQGTALLIGLFSTMAAFGPRNSTDS